MISEKNVAPKSKSFRYDINALRAIAVLGVVLYHYKVNVLGGGFAGVDVFFVISGYLMSKIIITSLSKEQFSYWGYLKKRVERIVPALLVLVLVVTSVTFYLYFPQDFVLNQRNAASSVVFLSNVYYWTSSDYFAAASETNLFLHTWSLSVEWQFYMIYPFFLMLLGKLVKDKKLYTIIFTGLTVLMLLLSLFASSRNPSGSFYLLPTRAWEMLFGGVAFLAEGYFRSRWNKWIAIAGYLIIFASFFTFTTDMTWPGKFTLIPVVATFFVIVANVDNFFILKSKPVQFIGKISYSIYLWHWPIIVIAQYYGVETTPLNIVIFSALSILLGYLSFQYVENFKISNYRLVPIGMVVLFAGTFLLGHYSLNNIMFKPKTVEIANYSDNHEKELYLQYRRDTCHVKSFEDFDKTKCLCLDSVKPNILLIGDSHMGQLAQSFREYGIKHNINFLQATASATLATLKDVQHRDPKGRALMNYIFKDFIPANHTKIAGVIIGGSWSGQKGGEKGAEMIANETKKTVAYLEQFGLKVMVIGDTERYSIPYPTIAARDYENNTKSANSYISQIPYQVDAYLKKQLPNNHIDVINRTNFPYLSANLTPYMLDNHHVTKFGADILVAKISKNPTVLNLFKQN